MEFLVGASVAGILIAIFYFIHSYFFTRDSSVRLRVSQSRSFELMQPVFLRIGMPKRLNTQSSKHLEKTQVKILFTDQYAYWIKDNSVYRADLQDGLILEESAKVLDMMALDKVQLDEMIFIVEKLTEGKDSDYWGTGNT